MSIMMKLIIPLLDDALTKEDVTEEAGFVNAYMFDKNRPYLDNHIFLVYKLPIQGKEAFNREVNFSTNCKNIQGYTVQEIKGIPYKIYAFPIINPDIKRILNECRKPGYVKSSVRIMSFWRGYDNDVNNIMFLNMLGGISRDWNSIPEYDYKPPFSIEDWCTKNAGLPVHRQLGICFY